MEQIEDDKIIELYFARDERAIRQTEQKYKRLFFRILDNILFDREDSEECVNDTLLKVWESIPPARPNNFKAFVCKIARNIALNRYKFSLRQKRSRELEISLDEIGECIPDERLSSRLDDEELGQAINSFLKTISEEARNVFIRKYWYFDTISDIMKRYSFSESKVNNILYHTRNKLRDYLKKEGIFL